MHYLKLFSLLPAAILVWLFYILPLYLLGWISFFKKEETLIWHFKLIKSNGWYAKLWESFAGWSGPFVIVTRMPKKGDAPEIILWWSITIKHEIIHCHQQVNYGLLFYPLYLFYSLRALLKGKDFYMDNDFEVEARKLSEKYFS